MSRTYCGRGALARRFMAHRHPRRSTALAGPVIGAQDPCVLTVVYQDDSLVAVDKPAGLLVHRTWLDAGERDCALQTLRNQLQRRVYPVHRLDRATSGVLLFALDVDVGAALSGLFANRQVEKTYLAVVRGRPPERETIDHPLPARIEMGSGAAGRTPVLAEAITHSERLATVDLPHADERHPTSRYSLVRLEPRTGRPHQLRRHMKHRSHPIIGDTTYGKGQHNRLFREQYDCGRLLLACVELRMPHPRTDDELICTAPLAPDFARLVDRFGWRPSVPARWLAPA